MAKDKAQERRQRRARRHARIQKTVRGVPERPRLVISRSHKNIEGQLVDDDRGVTLLGVNTRAPEVREQVAEDEDGRVAEAFAAGKVLAERALDAGVEKVVFDRAGYPYRGRVRAFAEGAREGGLDF